MNQVEEKLHRLSPNQLRALQFLAMSPKGVIYSSDSGDIIGLRGKHLGGLFSSLSRQLIEGEHLVMPWGRPVAGGGLRWKLNTNLISQKELLAITKSLLEY